MTTSIGQVYSRYMVRSQAQTPLVSKWREVRDTYNTDLAVPLPELSAKEKPAVPNLLAQGVDHMAERIASTLPDINYPPVRPNIQSSINRASDRRKANLAWWTENNLNLKLRRRARHHVAYGMTVVQIEPDLDAHLPRWRVRNPLTAYPAQMSDPDEFRPSDCIFAVSKSVEELRLNYPNLAMLGAFDAPSWGSQRWTLLESVTATETITAVIGPAIGANYEQVFSGLGKQVIQVAPMVMGKRGQVESMGTAVMELERVPNRIGMCPVVTPGRITLDRVAGMFEGMIGQYQMMARLMALDVIAVEQSIFPDLWFVEEPNQTGDIERAADGRAGIIGRVSGGQLEAINPQPGVQTGVTMDRLERSMRQNGGIPSQFGGEAPTNIRTGRASEVTLSASIDPAIQEAQEIFAASLAQENRIAVATAKAYWGREAQSFTVSWNKAKGRADYTADDIFTESDTNTVTYAMAGADVNNLTVGVGQMVGLELLSKDSARKLHPLIDDPEHETRQVEYEQLAHAQLVSILQGATDRSMDPTDIAFIAEFTRDGKGDIFAAVRVAHERAQARQASSGPPGTPEGPVEPGSPEAQPGLAAGTPAAPGAAQPTVGPPPQAVGNIADLIRQLHSGSQGHGGPPTLAPGRLAPTGAPVGQ